MISKVRAFCEKYDMLRPGERILCACSGGADSTALLHFLCASKDVDVVCAHFDHRLRGEESARDAKFVRALCESLGVPCVVGSGDVASYAREHAVGTETAARALRYAFLERTAEEHGCSRIATAHHAEDNAETVLMHLLRGSGALGLSGIPPVRGKIIRPLLTVTRGEIEAYLRENDLRWVEDSTNGSDDCVRNRIRHRVLPLLTAENPAAVAHICEAAALAREDEEYLSAQAERFISAQQSGGEVSAAALAAIPKPVAARVLRRFCGPVAHTQVDALLALCRSESPHAALDLPGRRVRRDFDRLSFNMQLPEPLQRRELPYGVTELPELGLRILRRCLLPGEKIHNSFNNLFFQSDSIRGMMFVAAKNDGDRIRLSGRGCTKTLKKLFSEAAIPPEERKRIPVFYDAEGVVAVRGFGVAERCAAVQGEASECVEITETEKNKREREKK